MNFNFVDTSKMHLVPKGEEVKTIIEAHNVGSKKYQAKRTKGYADPNLMGSPVVVVNDRIQVVDGTAYEMIFEPIDLRSSTNNTMMMLDVTGGITFHQHAPGTETIFSELPATAEQYIKMLRFTGGLAISNDWKKYNHYYLVTNVLNKAFTGWRNRRATLAYSLMENMSSAINVAAEATVAQTINKACGLLHKDLENDGYADLDNAEYVITCRTTDKPAIKEALAAQYHFANTNNKKVEFNFKGIGGTNRISEGIFYISLPGEENQLPEWEDYNARPPQGDEKKLGTDHVWTGAYNIVIGNENQHRRCSLS